MIGKFDYGQFHNLMTEGKIDEAFDYRASFTPDYLYKFYPLVDNPVDDFNDKRFYSLANNYIWFATPEMQNDPYEFEGIYWDDNILIEAGVPKQSIEYAKQLFFYQIVLSAFTANMSNNLSMWAHYANNHHGYCVKYKVRNKRVFRNVIYTDHRISMTKTFLNFLHQGLRGLSIGDVSLLEKAKIDSSIFQDKFFCKHTSWEYENEFRALYKSDGEKTGLNVPIDELGLTVVEIYSGINCESKNIKELERIASTLQVSHKECKKHEREFTIFY